MEEFKKEIEILKEKFRFIHNNKETEGLDKYMLFNAYSRVNGYFNLNFESADDFKKILLDAQRKAYTLDKKTLTNEEIIVLEYKRAKDEYERKNLINKNKDKKDIENIEYQKLVLVEYYFSQINIFKELDKEIQEEHLDTIKLLIIKIHILLGIENGLYYETFQYLAKELNCLDIINISSNKNFMASRR